MNEALLRRLPDLPRWVEARSYLLWRHLAKKLGFEPVDRLALFSARGFD
jgi:hypothetical protein